MKKPIYLIREVLDANNKCTSFIILSVHKERTAAYRELRQYAKQTGLALLGKAIAASSNSENVATIVRLTCDLNNRG